MAGSGRPAWHRSALLVVDDDPVVRRINTRALAEEGYGIVEAADGLQALALLQDQEGDAVQLVVTDIRMPGMSGDDLGRILRGLRPGLPFPYLSGYSAPSLDFLAPTELQRCWLAKPFTPGRLVSKVRELLRGGLVTT